MTPMRSPRALVAALLAWSAVPIATARATGTAPDDAILLAIDADQRYDDALTADQALARTQKVLRERAHTLGAIVTTVGDDLAVLLSHAPVRVVAR